MSTDLIHIPFHGGEVLAVDIDGKPFIVLRPFIEALGLTYAAQYRKLQGRSWATVAERATVGADGKDRAMTTVDVRTAMMLLATINENNVPEDRRPLLVAYQAEVADVIEAYWTRGGAINPRATEDQLAAVVDIATRQMGLLAAARGLLPADWLAAKARIVAQRGLGEVPSIAADDMPLYVDTFLGEKGLSALQIKALRSPFGRRVAGAYYDEHGRRPEKAPAEVDGRPRMVNVYYGRDRAVFERTWQQHFAAAFDDLFGGAA